jgi:hypothetical protein
MAADAQRRIVRYLTACRPRRKKEMQQVWLPTM